MENLETVLSKCMHNSLVLVDHATPQAHDAPLASRNDLLHVLIQLVLSPVLSNEVAVTDRLLALLKELGHRFNRSHLEVLYSMIRVKAERNDLNDNKLLLALRIIGTFLEHRYSLGAQNYFYFTSVGSGISILNKGLLSQEWLFSKVRTSKILDT